MKEGQDSLLEVWVLVLEFKDGEIGFRQSQGLEASEQTVGCVSNT